MSLPVKLSSLALAVAGAILAPTAHSQDLFNAYRLAWENDQTLKSAKARLDGVRESVGQIEARQRPSVFLQVNRSRVTQVRKDNGQTFGRQYYPGESESLSIRQSLYNRRTSESILEAKQAVVSAEAELDGVSATVAERLVLGYLELMQAQDQMGTTDWLLKAAQERMVAAERALAAGTGVRTDIDEVQAQIDRYQADMIQFELALRSAEARLAALMGAPIGKPFRLQAAALDGLRFDEMPLQQWLTEVTANSPMVDRERSEVDRARRALRVVDSDRYPVVDLTAQATRSVSDSGFFVNTETESALIGVQVQVPIYSGGLISANTRQAMAQIREAEARAEATVIEATTKARQFHDALVQGFARVRALQTAVRSAEQAIVGTRRSLEAGVRTQLDVLLAEQRRAETEMQLSMARYQALAAWVQLNALAGKADEQMVMKLDPLFVAAGPEDRFAAR